MSDANKSLVKSDPVIAFNMQIGEQPSVVSAIFESDFTRVREPLKLRVQSINLSLLKSGY